MFRKSAISDAAASIIEVSKKHRELESQVNKEFGVYSRNALPHEKLPEYDSRLNSLKESS